VRRSIDGEGAAVSGSMGARRSRRSGILALEGLGGGRPTPTLRLRRRARADDLGGGGSARRPWPGRASRSGCRRVCNHRPSPDDSTCSIWWGSFSRAGWGYRESLPVQWHEVRWRNRRWMSVRRATQT